MLGASSNIALRAPRYTPLALLCSARLQRLSGSIHGCRLSRGGASIAANGLLIRGTSCPLLAPAQLQSCQRRSRCMAVAPWTREDIQEMMEEEELAREQELGEEWRSHFEEDVSKLHQMPQVAMDYWTQNLDAAMQMTKEEYEESNMMENLHRFPAPMANDMIGMGTWRLRGRTDPAIAHLVTRIEGQWREMCQYDLNLYPAELWKKQGLDFCDNVDPEKELHGFAHADVPDPEKGEEGYPRLLLENRVYCSRVFRRLHMEVAWRQDGLHVLHAVLYPRYQYDLPILAMDIVIAGGAVTLAIIDACPVRGKKLPPHYMQTMKDLQDSCLTDPNNQRAIPEWGTKIFSPLCVCMRPKDGEELAGFMRYTEALHRAHMMMAKLAQPIEATDKRSALRLEELLAGHKSFVENQLANKKTTRILEAAFGVEWTHKYMTTMMFDFDPKDDPDFHDSSVERLYEYFDRAPELGTFPQELAELTASQELDRAEEYIDQAFGLKEKGGQRVSQGRVEWALLNSFDTDPDFHATVMEMVPGAEEMKADGTLGAHLSEYLRAIAGLDWEQNVDSKWVKAGFNPNPTVEKNEDDDE